MQRENQHKKAINLFDVALSIEAMQFWFSNK